MDNKIFDELLESVQQAGKIERGAELGAGSSTTSRTSASIADYF